MSVRILVLSTITSMSLAACKGTNGDTSGGGDGGSVDTGDTGDTGTGGPSDWGPAAINPGTYTMRLLGVNQNSCTPEYAAGSEHDVEIIPAGGMFLLWDYVILESRDAEMRAQGRNDVTNDATGDGTPDCTITYTASASGNLVSATEFDLNFILERVGVGDYCGSEYIGFTVPCTDAFTGVFQAPGGGGGGGGGGAGGEDGG